MNYATKERELMRRSYGNRLHLHFYKSNQNKKYSLDFYTNQEKEKKLKDL